MTTFNWQIDSMPSYPDVDNHADVVFQVNWSCKAVDGTFTASSFGSVPVAYQAGSPFTPYDQLTQSQVWGWINPDLDKPAIEANLQQLIDEQKLPKTVTPPLPWATPTI